MASLNIFDLDIDSVEKHISEICKDMTDEQINLKIKQIGDDTSYEREESYWRLKNGKRIGKNPKQKLDDKPVRDYATLMKDKLQLVQIPKTVMKDNKLVEELTDYYVFIQPVEDLGEFAKTSESEFLAIAKMSDEDIEHYTSLKAQVLDGNEAVISALYKLEQSLIAKYSITHAMFALRLDGIADEKARDEHMLAKSVARRAFKNMKLKYYKSEILSRKASAARSHAQSRRSKFVR